MDKKAKGMILAIAGGICWGLAAVFGQYLFAHNHITAKWLVSVRLLLAGTLLLLPVFIREKRGAFAVWKNKADAVKMLTFAVFGMGFCQLAYYIAIEQSNAGTATVLQYSGPAMIMLYFCVRDKKLPTISQVVALFMTMIGVWLLATKGDMTSLNISKEALLLGIASAVALALYNIIPGELMEKYGTVSVCGWGMLVAGILLAGFVKPWQIVGTWDLNGVCALAVVIILGTVISFSLYMEGVKLAGPETASMIASVEPVTATIATIVMMKISFTFPEILGIISIVIAVTVLSIKKDSSEPSCLKTKLRD